MKRLIKKADAARLTDCKLDDQTSFQIITGKDERFRPENIVNDTAAGKKAYWGAISDDAVYSVEAYVYNVSGDRKCAFVYAEIVDGTPINYDAIVKPIENMSEIRQTAKSGFNAQNGNKIICSNEFNSYQQAVDHVSQTQQQQTV